MSIGCSLVYMAIDVDIHRGLLHSHVPWFGWIAASWFALVFLDMHRGICWGRGVYWCAVFGGVRQGFAVCLMAVVFAIGCFGGLL